MPTPNFKKCYHVSSFDNVQESSHSDDWFLDIEATHPGTTEAIHHGTTFLQDFKIPMNIDKHQLKVVNGNG